ncbi:SDR family oxidoreductase [Pseudonocardia xinjiangensis]
MIALSYGAAMPTALVTGASRGLGAAFAQRLARDGFDLVLVARDNVGLQRVAGEAARLGIKVEVLAADLADAAERAAVERRIADRARPVDLLVNNASYECGVDFRMADPEPLQTEIDVNVTAVMILTHAALPGMIERGRGSVINVASFAGYLSASGSAHSATKAWMIAFTDTVEASLAGTGVRMIALVPGRLRTGKHRELEPTGTSMMWLEPDAVVDACIADLARGRTVCTPGLLYNAVVRTLETPRRTLRTLARLTGHRRGQMRQPVPGPRPEITSS